MRNVKPNIQKAKLTENECCLRRRAVMRKVALKFRNKAPPKGVLYVHAGEGSEVEFEGQTMSRKCSRGTSILKSIETKCSWLL